MNHQPPGHTFSVSQVSGHAKDVRITLALLLAMSAFNTCGANKVKSSLSLPLHGYDPAFQLQQMVCPLLYSFGAFEQAIL